MTNKSIKAFKNDGSDSLPAHVGYKQLAIILEKEQKFEEVLKLVTTAKEQGWKGDWDKRIERCLKKN